ncbi:MAG: cardiolipin synthase [Prevotella sp.]|nr:cardiolipin synthase [Bacteroides sp.]MCM1367068.1 cardiolipin synthase [Prevotella sp.]MCM1437550.1 cardiolipin synthase [Prevotella sp.]
MLSENRSPIRSLAWIIALIFLPGIGLIFYLFFGRSLKSLNLMFRHNKRKILRNKQRKPQSLSDTGLPIDRISLVKLANNLCHYPLTIHNQMSIFTDGYNKFQTLIEDLENAQTSIYLQYYIIEDDVIGRKISEILCRKASEGISVKVIYDHVGSFSSPSSFFKTMQKAGVDVQPFFRVTFPQFANRINWRNHRKIVIIDSTIGYIGGMNIADRYTGVPSHQNAWRDTHFRLEGEIVQSMLYSFALDYNFLKKDIKSFPYNSPPSYPESVIPMQLITGGPTEQRDNLSLCFLKAILSAKKCIYIQTPYFLPTDALLHALEAAAIAQIDVRIMLPDKSDSKLLELASLSYVTQCMRAGIKVYLYNPGMLHAKAMIIDDDFVTAGSTNFDFRSLENNFEANLMIYSPNACKQMKEIFFKDRENCTKLTISHWKKRPLLQRALESFVRLLAPIL